MEDVADGVTVKETVKGDIVKPGVRLIDDITEWFDGMVKDTPMSRIKPVDDDVNKIYGHWEESAMRVSELDRIEKRIIHDGVNENTRTSLESYIPATDEYLPDPRMYTTAASSVNYDTTLTWVKTRGEVAQCEQIRLGARFMSMSLHWIKQYGIAPSGDDTLEKLIEVSIDKDKEVKELMSNSDITLDNSEAFMLEMFRSLNLDPETIDVQFMTHWSSKLKKITLLNRVFDAHVPQTLNALTMGSGLSALKEHGKMTEKMVNQIVDAMDKIADLNPTMVSSSLEIEKTTNDFTVELMKAGWSNGIAPEYVNSILKNGEDNLNFIDDDLEDKLVSVRDKLIATFYPTDDGNTFESSEALSQAMDQNCRIMAGLLDSMRLTAGVYNSLIDTAVAKNNALTVYGMFLRTLIE